MDKRNHMGKATDEVIIPVAPIISEMSDTYLSFIDNIKNEIEKQRLSVVLSANASMICLIRYLKTRTFLIFSALMSRGVRLKLKESSPNIFSNFFWSWDRALLLLADRFTLKSADRIFTLTYCFIT